MSSKGKGAASSPTHRSVTTFSGSADSVNALASPTTSHTVRLVSSVPDVKAIKKCCGELRDRSAKMMECLTKLSTKTADLSRLLHRYTAIDTSTNHDQSGKNLKMERKSQQITQYLEKLTKAEKSLSSTTSLLIQQVRSLATLPSSTEAGGRTLSDSKKRCETDTSSSQPSINVVNSTSTLQTSSVPWWEIMENGLPKPACLAASNLTAEIDQSKSGDDVNPRTNTLKSLPLVYSEKSQSANVLKSCSTASLPSSQQFLATITFQDAVRPTNATELSASGSSHRLDVDIVSFDAHESQHQHTPLRATNAKRRYIPSVVSYPDTESDSDLDDYSPRKRAKTVENPE